MKYFMRRRTCGSSCHCRVSPMTPHGNSPWKTELVDGAGKYSLPIPENFLLPHPMRSAICSLAAILLSPIPTGCCSLSLGMASLLCGPRQDPWVQVAFATPEETVATFLGAVARDDVEVIYQCLSEQYKEDQKLSGLEVGVAWKHLKQEVPGIHLADRAKASPMNKLGPQQAEVTLTLARKKIRLLLIRQSYWTVQMDLPEGEGSDRHGEYIPRLETYIHLHHKGESTAIQAMIPQVDVPNLQMEEISGLH